MIGGLFTYIFMAGLVGPLCTFIPPPSKKLDLHKEERKDRKYTGACGFMDDIF